MFLVADTQLYMRLCLSARTSWNVKNTQFRCVFLWVLVGEHGVWMGVGCPCPPVLNNFVTPSQLLTWAWWTDGISRHACLIENLKLETWDCSLVCSYLLSLKFTSAKRCKLNDLCWGKKEGCCGPRPWRPPVCNSFHKIFAFPKCLSFDCNAKGCFYLFLKAK